MFNLAIDKNFTQDLEHGFLHRIDGARGTSSPRLIVNDDEHSMLRAISEELSVAGEFVWSVAFVTSGGLFLLKQQIMNFLERGGRGRIITSDYLGFNDPAMFRELLSLRAMGIHVRVYRDSAFHPKGYVFRRHSLTTAIIGSSNLTRAALVKTHEWNLRVTSSLNGDLTSQLQAAMTAQVRHSDSLTPEWVEKYAETYQPPAATRVRHRTDSAAEATIVESETYASLVLRPNKMQARALDEIRALRESGERRALVVSATGTGKTILSAFDVKQADPQRFLFVVHREQILDKAMQEYAKVLGVPIGTMGKLSGSSRDVHQKYVFATVQSLSRAETLSGFAPDHFDYILIDEVHRAGASSYERILAHFAPEFVLGMTATPERTDGYNIFEVFDYNVAYEIRLGEALEEGMLTPFHYFGVADYVFTDGSTTDDYTTIHRLASNERVWHIVRALETYGIAGEPVRGLMFCGRNEEATALSEALNQVEVHGRRLRTVALSGDTKPEARERAVEDLVRGDLDYILTVDIFNEGIDIPPVNQIVMLRKTQSAIVFVQQLGRGLRKHEGKDFTVVIDFIGNYATNYLIPVALMGDDSHNKESVRQKLISAEEIGVVAGISSVRFDKVARERVLASIATTKFDELRKLRASLQQMQNRVGRLPSLHDFYRFESVDPVVLATRSAHFPQLLNAQLNAGISLTAAESRYLEFLSHEVLTTKRPHDLGLLRVLLAAGPSTTNGIQAKLKEVGVELTRADIESAISVLTLDFNSSKAELQRYKVGIAERVEGTVRLRPDFLESYRDNPDFKHAVDDLVFTGLELIEERYDASRPFTPGKMYGRKDACRSLLWPKNVQSTVYGYKVDPQTETCPIFVTLHKADDVSSSTAYEDALIDPSAMLWFTRNRRTLRSQEVDAIVSNRVTLHVFAKKDDAEGSDFYYLGRAIARAPEETTMLNDKAEQLPVVKMLLHFDEPIQAAVFDYFEPVLTESG